MRTSTKKTRLSTTGVTAASSMSLLRIMSLPIGQLDPNDYNPNKLTDEEFGELVAEVRRLERPPKPIVVRPKGDRWLIVDGEHGWRAAREVGLTVVPCEVIDADDFEAMRQTFKRNQHGAHNSVLLGRMFLAMTHARDLSHRDLATEINVSEGTIRNAIMYADAAALRNCYAAKSGASEQDAELAIAQLAVRQVRAYIRLPAPIRDVWLDGGADMKALAQAAIVRIQDEETGKFSSTDFSGEDGGIDGWRELVEAGLAGGVTSDAFVTSAHEAFRLWLFFQEFRGHIENFGAYLRPMADLHLSSEWVCRLPIRLTDDRFEVLVSPAQWEAILRDCMSRAQDDPENMGSLLGASIRLALRESGVSPLDVTDPRVIEARQMVADGPAFVRESSLSLSDQCALVRLLRTADVDPVLGLEAVRQACHLLEGRNRIREGEAPVGMPERLRGQLTDLSPTTAFNAAVARLHHEQTMAERQRLVNDPVRLREALVERLYRSAIGDIDDLTAGRPVRDIMAERLAAVPLPELQLLGAAALGYECGTRTWLDTLRDRGSEPAK